MTIPDSWFAFLRIETTFPTRFDERLCMARISLLSPQKNLLWFTSAEQLQLTEVLPYEV